MPTAPKQKKDSQADRRARQAEALRANLLRRKSQQRGREDTRTDEPVGEQPEDKGE